MISDKGILIVTNYIVRQAIKQGVAAGWTPTECKEMISLRSFHENIGTSKTTFIVNIKDDNHAFIQFSPTHD